jgi:nicotinamidase-related amidase
MSDKMKNLQHALNSTAGTPAKRSPQHSTPTAAASHDAPKSPKNPPKHLGKETISTWLHPDFKKSLRLVQLRKEGKVYLDDLIAEALNDLFKKYDAPLVRHE